MGLASTGGLLILSQFASTKLPSFRHSCMYFCRDSSNIIKSTLYGRSDLFELILGGSSFVKNTLLLSGVILGTPRTTLSEYALYII